MTQTPPADTMELTTDASSPVEKAARILKAVASLPDPRLTDIARYCGINKATALRLMSILEKEGLIQRNTATKRYALGTEAALIGMAARERIDWRAIARPSLMRLSSQWGDTVILSLLSGLELVCVDIQTGHYPIQANYQQIGSRRSLGAGSSGIAILAAMPENERATALSCLARHAPAGPAIDLGLLTERIDAAQTNGYATLLHAVVPEMGGIAVAIQDTKGRPFCALSLPTLASRITDREAEIAHSLRQEAESLELAFRAPTHPDAPLA